MASKKGANAPVRLERQDLRDMLVRPDNHSRAWVPVLAATKPRSSSFSRRCYRCPAERRDTADFRFVHGAI